MDTYAKLVSGTDVIAYKADADTFCPPCAHLLYDRVKPDGVVGSCGESREGFKAVDNEGNEVFPIFVTDINQFPEGITCGRCLGDIVEMDEDLVQEDDDPLLDFGDQAYDAS